MFGQRALDLGGVDIAPADGEHIDPPIGQIQIAVGVEPAEVTQRVPGAQRIRANFGGAADIAIGGSAARTGTHVDFPDHTGRALLAVVVEHRHLPGHHSADRAPMTEPFGAADERQGLKFGAAVEFPDHVRAEDLDPGLLDRGRAGRGQVPPPPHRRQVEALRFGAVNGQQSLHDGRNGGQIVDPILGDESQEIMRVETIHQHQMLTCRQCHGGGGETGVVAQRYRYQLGVAGQVAHHRRHQGALKAAVATRLDQFRPAGASAGRHRFQRW